MIEVRDLHTYRGINYVLQGVSLRISDGSCTVLLGRNGMGKTTLVHTIMGMLRPATGAIMLDDEELTGKQPFQIAQRGLALVPQGRRIFPSLTVEENLTLGFLQVPHRSAGDNRAALRRIYDRFPRLAERRRQDGTTLSGGEQQMLAMARVMVGEPKLLLVDEPSEGLAPMIVVDLYAIIAEMKRAGCAILLVEQNVGQALDVCDRFIVIERGSIVLSGDARAPSDRDKLFLTIAV